MKEEAIRRRVEKWFADTGENPQDLLDSFLDRFDASTIRRARKPAIANRRSSLPLMMPSRQRPGRRSIVYVQ